MQRTVLGWVVVSSLAVAALVGCAVGDEADVGYDELQTVPSEAGTGDETSVKLPPKSADEDAGAEEPEEETDGGAEGGGGSTDAGTVDSGTDAGGGGTTSCASPNVCTASTNLGSVSGDTGSGVKTAQGSGSQWFKVRVSEDDSSVFGTKLAVKGELTSPAGTNFDLYMYVAGNETAVSCSGVTKSSTSTGADAVSTEWGEGTISNGSNDDRYVTFEVRWVSGTCAPTSKWTLTVRGNQL